MIVKDKNRNVLIAELHVDVDQSIDPYQYLTKEEIVSDIIKNRLRAEDKEFLIASDHDDLIQLHFSLGRWIRNTYGLWMVNNPLTDCSDVEGPLHPDQFSNTMIELVYNQLNVEHSFDSSREVMDGYST